MAQLKITVLGSGTISAPDKRNPAGYLLKDVASGKEALLDCGPGILKQLYAAGSNPSGLDCIFISHYHVDHSSDLLPILLNRHLEKNGSNRALTVAGPKDIRDWFAAQASLQGSWMNEKGPRVKPVDAIQEWCGWKIETCLTGHTENSLAFAFSRGDKKIFYSGDSGYNEAIVQLTEDADLAICECALPDDSPHKGHMTPADLLRFAEAAQPKKVLATHIYPDNDPPRFKKQNDRITIAEDMLEQEI